MKMEYELIYLFSLRKNKQVKIQPGKENELNDSVSNPYI